jgi:uncharacterized coiled-coil protein SlyX
MTTADTLWDALLPAALLGTERHTLQLPPDAPHILHALPATDPEARLLATAATAAMMRRSGHIPPEDTHLLPDPAPEEILPVCSPRSARRLHTLLGQTLGQGRPPYLSLLIEWLHIIRQRGKRVPYSALPALLDLTYRQRSDVDFVRLVSEVLGERGRWLAQTNMRFEYLLIRQELLLSIDVLQDTAVLTHPDEERIIYHLQKETPEGLEAAVAALAVLKQEWSDQLVMLLLRILSKRNAELPSVPMNYYAPHFAACIPSRRLDYFLAGLKSLTDAQQKQLKTLIDKIEFRRDMLLELANE